MILNALYHIISLWCSRYSSFSITITLILCFPDWCPPTPAPLQEKLVPLPLHWRLLHVWSLTVLTMSRYKHVPSDSVVLTSKRWYLNFGIIPFMSMQSQSEQWRNVLIWCHFVYIWTENRSNNDPSLYFLHSSYTLKTFELISLLNFPYISRSKLQRQGQSEEQLLACSRSRCSTSCLVCITMWLQIPGVTRRPCWPGCVRSSGRSRRRSSGWSLTCGDLPDRTARNLSHRKNNRKTAGNVILQSYLLGGRVIWLFQKTIKKLYKKYL